MNLKSNLSIAGFAGSLLVAGSLLAATVKHDVPAGLAKEAKITLEAARATALAKVPHGELRSEELERENGKLIYSFDLQVPGKSGTEEVNVNAIDGKVVGVEHETAKTEKAEARQEAKGGAAAAAGYHVVKEIPLGGEGGWDYLTVDAAARRLYVSHSTKVTVIDVDSGKPVGDVEKLSGVHGIAFADDLGRGFISNGRSSTVTIFDLKTLATLSEVKVTGENPDAILYDPFSSQVFAFNGRSKNATVLEAKTGKVVGTIELGGKPEFATTDLKGRIFVNMEDLSEIAVIDAKTLAVKAHWPLKPCQEPSGMAIDRKHHRLLSGCDNEMAAVVSTDSGKVITTVPIGEGVDANAFDPGTDLGFSSNGGAGTLTVIREETPDRFSVVENVPTRKGARTMALDEKTHTVYLATAQFGPPPAATTEQPHPRPTILPNTFTILVVSR
jgi:DNA-binding beta-propeller fold protein YncE